MAERFLAIVFALLVLRLSETLRGIQMNKPGFRYCAAPVIHDALRPKSGTVVHAFLDRLRAGQARLLALARVIGCPGKTKSRLDKKMKAELKDNFRPWQNMDLRRTARTLMSRAGVSEKIAERRSAHVLSGVEGTYNRYEFTDEKRIAFEALTSLVERILNPPADNVVSIAQK